MTCLLHRRCRDCSQALLDLDGRAIRDLFDDAAISYIDADTGADGGFAAPIERDAAA